MAAVITSPDYHIEQIRKLNDESKRLGARLKQLREEKKKHERHVFVYMTRTGVQEYKGIKKARIEPKGKVKRTPKKVRDARAYELCLRTGIPDPKGFLEQFKASQKPDQV
jgi:hypothetical protein